ncbi:chain-length determining protein [Pseudomonas gessardii]|nr:chain-length determining protein [Pseudomonas gessardii]
MDLYTLFKGVLEQKRLLISVTVGIGLIAAVYAFLATPMYRVSTVLRPAALNELDSLNRSEVYQLPPPEALIKVGASLESYDTRLAFFRANQKLFKAFERPGRTLEQSFEAFNRDSIKLVLPAPNKKDFLSTYIKLEMNYPEGIDGVAILNGFVEYAIANEREQIAADLRVIVNNRLNELHGKLDSARSNYEVEKEAKIASLNEADTTRRAQLQDELKALQGQLRTQRNDRIATLNEAISIARSLDIQKPTTPSSLGDSLRPKVSSGMHTEITNQEIPLYFMGIDALSAELTALRQRKTDDFTTHRISQIAKELQMLATNREVEVLNHRENEDIFLAGVQPLRAEIARLNNLAVDMSRIKLVTVDQQALEPLAPTHPQRFIIVLLGLLAGLALAVSFAVARYFYKTSVPRIK